MRVALAVHFYFSLKGGKEMKKTLIVLSMLALFCTMLITLASCEFGGRENQVEVGGTFIYVSNGDGTCYVNAIL